jgi:hypothetical protein
MKSSTHGQSGFLLSLEFLQGLFDTPIGLVMNASALMQHAVNGGFTDARLSRNLLDGESFGTAEHGVQTPAAEVFMRFVRAIVRFP